MLRNLAAARFAEPVLVISGGADVATAVEAMKFGALDFLEKPFRVDELVARLGLLLRAAEPSEIHVLRNGDLAVNKATREVTLAGEPIELTAFEFNLLVFLMLRQGRVVSRSDLISRFYPSAGARMSNTIEVYIGRLRRKIGASRIRTLKGFGYRLG